MWSRIFQLKISKNNRVTIGKRQRTQLNLSPGEQVDEFIFELGTGANRVMSIVIVRQEDVPKLMNNIHLQFVGGKRTYKPIQRDDKDTINYKDVVNEIKEVFKRKGMRIK